MFIRRTITRRRSGETYTSCRLVESRREGSRVRQVTVLNLGCHFEVPQEQWGLLCLRLEELLSGQDALLSVQLPETVEAQAQGLMGRLVAKEAVGPRPRAPAAPPQGDAGDLAEVDIDSLELLQPRSVGVEQVGLHALAQLGLEPFLASLGINRISRQMILAQIVTRMAMPGSELATWGWLNETSGLAEMLDLSLPSLSLMRLYRTSDVLLKYQEKIEAHLFAQVRDLFALQTTITLYDLTNTYFEGKVGANGKARRGHSKERRTDCPLLTLALVLDDSGFVIRSKVMAGNAVECRTLEGMLKDLDAPPGALVVMDRGIATEVNLAWLRERGYRYLVVSRERERRMPEGELRITTAGGEELRVEKVVDEASGEVRLICHSPLREEKGMVQRFCQRFEAGLNKLAQGLNSPRGVKSPALIHERIGKLAARCYGVGQHYEVRVKTDETRQRATEILWENKPVVGSMLTDPGVYVLRSNELSWDEPRLWHTYMRLTDLEAVFRSLKSELGLRPVYHHKEGRAEGHLFITVLAYQCVQLIRRQLQSAGIHDSWSSLRQTLSTQRRLTVRFRQSDGRTLHVRKSSQPEAELAAIYRILNIDPLPGGTKKLVA